MDLVATTDLSDAQLEVLLDRSAHWLDFNRGGDRAADALHGRSIVLAFF